MILKISHEIGYILFYMPGLHDPECVLHLWHISVQTSHISDAATSPMWPVATGVDSTAVWLMTLIVKHTVLRCLTHKSLPQFRRSLEKEIQCLIK